LFVERVLQQADVWCINVILISATNRLPIGVVVDRFLYIWGIVSPPGDRHSQYSGRMLIHSRDCTSAFVTFFQVISFPHDSHFFSAVKLFHIFRTFNDN